MEAVVSGEPATVTVTAAFAPTIQLALHCGRWKKGVPAVDGERGWEERVVGPLVSDMFEHMVSQRTDGMRPGSVVWKG